MFQARRHFLHKVVAWCGTGAVTGLTVQPGVATFATAFPLPSFKGLDPTEKTDAKVHSTSGPLLDWFYVHAGYVNYKNGSAERWDVPEGIEIAVQPAEKSDPLVLPDRPWEQAGIGYTSGTYKKDGKYVMHYHSYCIAESSDGFNWTKPDLGLVESQGSKNNNIIYTGPGSSGHIFEDPAAPASERFKLAGVRAALYYPHRFDKGGSPVPLGNEQEQSKRFEQQDSLRGKYQGTWGQLKGFLTGAVSPDGLHWRPIEKPLLAEWVDGDNIVHYDKSLGKYVGYLRFHVAGRRCVGRSETDDFRNFKPEKVVLQADALDPPDTSIYHHAYTAYPGREDLHLMFPSMYHQSRDNMDIQLAVSHDGFHWIRPDRKTPIIANGAPGSDDGGCIYVGPGLVELADGRWAATYWGTHDLHNVYDTDPVSKTRPSGTIRYAMWKRDRLAGIRAREFGRFTLRQDRYRAGENCPDAIEAPPNDHFPPLSDPQEPARQLKLNYKTEVGGWLRIELITFVGSMPYPQIPAIEGFSFSDCDVLTGDEVEKIVTWKGKSNIARLSDTLAVRVEMYKATLFSFAL
jgi:hypothetical protein